MAPVFDRQLTFIKQRFTEMQTVQSGLINNGLTYQDMVPNILYMILQESHYLLHLFPIYHSSLKLVFKTLFEMSRTTSKASIAS